MIQSVTVTNSLDESIVLYLRHPGTTGCIISNITGLNPVDATINITDLASLDGGRYNSARLGSRNITMDLVFVECLGTNSLWQSIETIRQNAYKFFTTKSKLTLTILTDNRRASIVGYVETCEVGLFAQQETMTVSIMCPDPALKDMDSAGNTVSLATGVGNSIPTRSEVIHYYMNNWVYDPPLRYRKPLNYQGDLSNGMTIEITIDQLDFPFGDSLSGGWEIKREAQTNYQHIANYYMVNGSKTYPSALQNKLVPFRSNFGISITNEDDYSRFAIDTYKLYINNECNLKAGDVIRISTLRGDKKVTLTRSGTTYNLLKYICSGSKWLECYPGRQILYLSGYVGYGNLAPFVTGVNGQYADNDYWSNDWIRYDDGTFDSNPNFQKYAHYPYDIVPYNCGTGYDHDSSLNWFDDPNLLEHTQSYHPSLYRAYEKQSIWIGAAPNQVEYRFIKFKVSASVTCTPVFGGI